MDVAIPIVFPDYLIAVNTPPVKLQIPVPHGIDLFPHVVRIPATHNRLPDLGHAGILFLNGQNGTTKYYEYGRYDRANLGLTRRVPVPDVVISNNGRPTPRSLGNTLRHVSSTSGQRGRISAAYIELPAGKFKVMLLYCQRRVNENSDLHREPYSLTGHSCIHFAKEVLEAASVDTPWMIEPRPIGYMDRIRADFPALDYDPRTHTLTVPGVQLSDPAAGPVRRAAVGSHR